MYSKEELEIVDYIEGKKPQSIENAEDKIAAIKSMVSAKYTTGQLVDKNSIAS